MVVYNDNVTIFDEILKGHADVMISESVKTLVQQKARPGLCAVNPERLWSAEMSSGGSMPSVPNETPRFAIMRG